MKKIEKKIKKLENQMPRFSRLFIGLIVEVAEGKGTENDPVRLVYYVHQDNTVYLGKIDNQ